MTSQIIYKGQLRTSATHIQSGTVIETDAPTDNQGKGERFSPTDLLTVALGTCMVTTMGIRARALDIELDETTVDVTKIMAAAPRRVSRVVVNIVFPASLVLDDQKRKFLEHVALTCPVQKSLHPDLSVDTQFTWCNADGTLSTTTHQSSSAPTEVPETPAVG